MPLFYHHKLQFSSTIIPLKIASVMELTQQLKRHHVATRLSNHALHPSILKEHSGYLLWKPFFTTMLTTLVSFYYFGFFSVHCFTSSRSFWPHYSLHCLCLAHLVSSKHIHSTVKNAVLSTYRYIGCPFYLMKKNDWQLIIPFCWVS